MSQTARNVIASVFTTTMLLLPLISYAALFSGPIVPVCNKTIGTINLPGGGTTQGFTDPCGWREFVGLANNILQFMVGLAVPLAAVAFAYAGWLYLSARGNPGQIGKAHGVFLNVGIGLVITLSAWAVVHTVLTSLAQSGTYIEVLGSGTTST